METVKLFSVTFCLKNREQNIVELDRPRKVAHANCIMSNSGC
jgi:hypothetical protein